MCVIWITDYGFATTLSPNFSYVFFCHKFYWWRTLDYRKKTILTYREKHTHMCTKGLYRAHLDTDGIRTPKPLW